MKKFYGTLLFILLLLSRTSIAHADLERMRRIENFEPSFQEVIDRALNLTDLNKRKISELERKIKKAPLFPQLYVGYDRSVKEDASITINDNVSVSSAGVLVGPDENSFDESVNSGDVLRVRASWQLNELMFNPHQFQIMQLEKSLRQEKNDFVDDVFKIYFERRKFQIQAELDLKLKPEKKAILISQVKILTDRLNSLTRNSFKKRWWNYP